MKNMVKLLKQSSISLHPEKHKGPTSNLTRRHNEREPGQRHSKQKYQLPDRTKDNIFETEKMTERMASVDVRLEADTGS